jgi:hypothetical protein
MPTGEATTLSALTDARWALLLFGGWSSKNGFADPLGTESVVQDDDGAISGALSAWPGHCDHDAAGRLYRLAILGLGAGRSG